ncbi:MAG: RsmD family RNA methyltransferase [Rikenellaceae bacterium]|nr:RsmD family RNA methyltransferase [Rikenellaceae bacterium]MCL2692758.1 RsmD family RNA methyltransferase [Rikenellaceae bacterium]
MRIISGTHKGRIIEPPRNLRARPTTDFAKENLFNVLGNLVDFEGLRVLDLFAGTGSIGYEFASRGAASVTAVEINTVHFTYIKRMACELGFANFHAVKANALRYLRATPQQFDLIFADPPYDLACSEELTGLALGNDILVSGGLFILEHARGADYSAHPLFIQSRSYGNVHFSIFEKR